MLLDRLVYGIVSGSIQRRLLAEPELTLQKAQNLAQAIESADKNAKDLQGQLQPPMTAVNPVTCKKGPPRGTRARTDPGKPMETPCRELSSFSGRSTDDDGARHRGSRRCYQ